MESNKWRNLSGLLKIADDQDQARGLLNSFQRQKEPWNFLVVQLRYKLHTGHFPPACPWRAQSL